MKWFRKIAYLFVLLCFTTALAQETTCAAIVQQAMNSVQDDCAPTGRNQACYGYVALDATPRENVPNFSFAKEGDLANVSDIDSLRLSALDVADNTWGIALMKLQANLPDTLPGQNVTFLLFGDVEVQNAVAPSTDATVQLSSNGNVNIRSTPSTNGSIIGSLSRGEALTANGRNDDSTWLRIQIPDSSAQGWVFAQLVTPASDVSALSVVDSTEAETFTPMQAFYFSTGITQTSCAEAPQDGILIQTPEGVGQVNLRANDVDIQLGSTAFLQAQPSSQMVVSVVEGEGRVTANGKTVVVPAGSQVFIPVNSDLHATGEPSDAQPYTEPLVQPLPIQLLPDAITIAPPASPDQIREANATPTPAQGGSGGSLSGGIPGFPGDLSGLTGMDTATFCALMDQAFASEGMSRSDYLAMLNQYAGQLPAEAQAGLNQISQMLNSCPG